MRRDDPPATRTTPVEITEDAWHQALNLVPPVAWRNDAAGESFKMDGRLTQGNCMSL